MDITTYALLKKKIDSLGISDAKILEVVETFLLAHPEYIGATDEQVAQIVANAAAIQELQAEAVTIVTLDEYNAFTEEQKKEKYIRRERYSGSCQRSFYVGDGLKDEDIKASFKHGILTLSIPKKDAKQVETKKYISIEG